jgi:DNA-binding GntR family transcriptional regulator
MDQQPLADARDPLPGEPEDRGPIVRQSLHEAIVTRVRDMIIEGTLASGTRIHEGNLGRELGVSRTPLREALKFLASEGLIELSPGRGAVVRQFTRKDIQDTLVVIGISRRWPDGSPAPMRPTSRFKKSGICTIA